MRIQFKKAVSRLVVGMLFMVLACGLSVTKASAASSNLDKIQYYEIKVDVRQDGTLDIRYYIDWEVLSDKNGKEPLSWVKVGIPNEHVDQIQSLTDNIDTIKYYSDNGGDYVRIDFTEDHYQGDVISFEFAIHQEYMYILDEKNVARYAFTPGWFEDIEIDTLQIEWTRTDNIVETDSNEQSSTYYIWSYADLAEGEKVTANVRYDSSTLGVDENKQYSEASDDESWFWVFIVILVIVVVVAVILAISDDGYGGGGGYGGGTYIHTSYRSSCAHSSCASSCACACACAGGGRAGCSVKGFYSNEVVFMSVSDFNKAADKAKKPEK